MGKRKTLAKNQHGGSNDQATQAAASVYCGGHGGHSGKSWNVAMAGEIVPNTRTVTAFNLVVTAVGTLIFSGADGTITAAFPPAT
jgi:hypothetical protein